MDELSTPTSTLQIAPRSRSIRTGLAAVFGVFVLLVSLLGAFSIAELRAVDTISREIRDRWLASTRVLGDLNNWTSDMRAAEASVLLARTGTQAEVVQSQIRKLDQSIASSQTDYGRIVHDAGEQELYLKFVDDWQAYRDRSNHVLAAAARGDRVTGAGLYMSSSSKAYDAASDALGVLTARTVVRASLASGRAQTTYRTARLLILAVIMLSAIGLVAAINYVTRAISAPLLELASTMRALADNDMRKAIQGADRRDEIGEMARAVRIFRANAIELALSQQGLRQQATMLEERLETERQLATLQRNFVSMASHEFRTPLNIIDGHSQRLMSTRHRITPDEIADRAQRQRRAVLRLRYVIEQMLDANLATDGEVGLYYHPEDFDPRAMLREVCQLHREISPGAEIVEHISLAPATATGDPRLLHQMTSNLISNAVKYSPEAARIEVHMAVDDLELVLTVSDKGIGVPDADLALIFDRYHRGGNTGGIVGTGVGLFLVRVVADLHGGRVEVASRLGEGSTFKVRLPILTS